MNIYNVTQIVPDTKQEGRRTLSGKRRVFGTESVITKAFGSSV